MKAQQCLKKAVFGKKGWVVEGGLTGLTPLWLLRWQELAAAPTHCGVYSKWSLGFQELGKAVNGQPWGVRVGYWVLLSVRERLNKQFKY